jgi:hypothetical protein
MELSFGVANIHAMLQLASMKIDFDRPEMQAMKYAALNMTATIETLEAHSNQDDMWNITQRKTKASDHIQLADTWQLFDISFSALNYFDCTQMSVGITALVCYLAQFIVSKVPALSKLQEYADRFANGPQGVLCWEAVFSVSVEVIIDLNDPWHRRMAKFGLEHLRQVSEQKCGPGELSEKAIRGAVNIVFGPLTRRANHQSVLQLRKLKEQWVTSNGFPFLLERTRVLIEQLPLGHLSTDSEVMVGSSSRNGEIFKQTEGASSTRRTASQEDTNFTGHRTQSPPSDTQVSQNSKIKCELGKVHIRNLLIAIYFLLTAPIVNHMESTVVPRVGPAVAVPVSSSFDKASSSAHTSGAHEKPKFNCKSTKSKSTHRISSQVRLIQEVDDDRNHHERGISSLHI